MQIREISTTSSQVLEALLRAIPFYKAVRKESEQQYQLLMQFSRIVQFDSGENILSRGDVDMWIYFVVKGQLIVSFTDKEGHVYQVNYITPGEVFGDLSVLLHSPRTADVSVDSTSREAVLFGTDFSLFGDLTDFRQVSLMTKLLYFRHTNHSLRWKLEMYRSKYRNHPMSDKHREVKPYLVTKDDEFELTALYEQSVSLAKLLLQWNKSFGNLSLTNGVIPGPNIDV